MYSAAQSAALAPRKELPSLIPGIWSRPADILIPNWQRGQPAALDVTVISTLQQATLQGAASTQGHALAVGVERKLAAHAEACRAAGIAFVPLMVESLGGWSKEAADTIAKIGRLQGQGQGISPAESICHLFQRCAMRPVERQRLPVVSPPSHSPTSGRWHFMTSFCNLFVCILPLFFPCLYFLYLYSCRPATFLVNPRFLALPIPGPLLHFISVFSPFPAR